MKEQPEFGTVINCIDGRTQQPVIDYIRQKYAVDIVDMITFPGADGIFSDELRNMELSLAKQSASISVEKHKSRIIAIVGHYDCAGNPGDKNYHSVQVRKAVEEISLWKLTAKVIGLYVNEKWQLEEIA
ncbi:MAG: carbonic anhydrase [Nitrososphaera sp.]|jgi:carbonic anhydrase-like protein